MKRILIIEDDYRHAEDLKRSVEQRGEIADVISTEAEFQKQLREGRLKSYYLAIADMMLRWTDAAPDMDLPPTEIIEEGSYTAGVRCCRALASQGVPCIIFTALSPEKIKLCADERFEVIHKDGPGYKAVLERISQPRP